MQRLGLEWLHRMAQEPKRLYRRYLLQGIPFLVQLLSSALVFRLAARRSRRIADAMRVIHAKAPLRVSFAGGGTDVPPFPEQEGGLVLSATINRYAYGALAPRSDNQIGLESVDFGLSLNYPADAEIVFDGRLDLAKAAIRKMGRGGYDLFLHSNAPPGSGLGSSSAVMVALIGLLKEFHGQPLTDYEVAELAFELERKDLGFKGGLQDQYAATFGGFNLIEFEGDRVIVNPLRISAGRGARAGAQHAPVLHGPDPVLRSDHRAPDQTAGRAGTSSALAGLRAGKELAVAMKNALLQRRLTEFGELLGAAWEQKKQLSSKISNEFIDTAYESRDQAGRTRRQGHRCGRRGIHAVLLPVSEKASRRQRAASSYGGEVTEFEFTSNGLTTWSVHE